ncbi:MAG: hypothetical protein ISS53_00540 [Dehalococcoidia bacterium]|nr:hypothetical protein [Dehalococcoidia bacterium]
MVSSHALAQLFIRLFDDPDARNRVEAYHTHTRINAFNLATTSLRHIHKWYDRLRDVDEGLHMHHGNYYSDPESLGLVSKTSPTSAVLTSAGTEFLATARLYYNDPQRAEYALNKVLYYGGHNLGVRPTRFVELKRRYLHDFLRRCRLTPNARMVVDDGRLLVIAEILSLFGLALERFLLCSEAELSAFADLGENGFGLFLAGHSTSPGLTLLARRIGGDYTRASLRRRNYLLSHLFLALRADLMRTGSQVLPLTTPYPFGNLVSQSTAADTARLFTDDLTIHPEAGGYVVFRQEAVSAQPTAPSPGVVRLATTPRPRPRSGGALGATVQRRGRESYTVEAPLAVEAEDFVERMLTATYGSAVWRVGHTAAETAALNDGLLPGADIIIRDNSGNPIRFVEVKSARTDPPRSIRLTAAEYFRAMKCVADGIPYDLHVVSFVEGRPTPATWVISNFAQQVSGITLGDVLSMEIRIEPA